MGPKYRNANGVSMKLANFRRVDRHFAAQGKVGLDRGSGDKQATWDEYAHDPARLSATAAAIRSVLASVPAATGGPPAPALPNAIDIGGYEALEGAVLTRMHRFRERNRALVKKAKDAAFKAHGKIVCAGCGIDPVTRYGPLGAKLVEAHHTRPLRAVGDGARTKIADLALLCPTCHRAIHARRPWLSMDELRATIREAS